MSDYKVHKSPFWLILSGQKIICPPSGQVACKILLIFWQRNFFEMKRGGKQNIAKCLSASSPCSFPPDRFAVRRLRACLELSVTPVKLHVPWICDIHNRRVRLWFPVLFLRYNCLRELFYVVKTRKSYEDKTIDSRFSLGVILSCCRPRHILKRLVPYPSKSYSNIARILNSIIT